MKTFGDFASDLVDDNVLVTVSRNGFIEVYKQTRQIVKLIPDSDFFYNSVGELRFTADQYEKALATVQYKLEKLIK
jgi:hypothetical protein